jgi:hypothetical protein
MDNKDRVEFTEVIRAMAAAFNKDASKAFLTGYWMGLSDLSLSALKVAATAALNGSKFMPSPAELRELAGEVRIEDRAQLAFAALENAMRRHGYYSSVDFEDKAINATVRALGGWEKVCDIPDDEFFNFFPKKFKEMYSAYARRGVSQEAGAPCIGYHDRNNAFNGHKAAIREPVKIGSDYPPTPLIAGPVPNQQLPRPRLKGPDEIEP